MEKSPQLYVSLVYLMQKKYTNISPNRCKRTVKGFSTNHLRSYRSKINNNSTVSLSVHIISHDYTCRLTQNNLPSNIINNFTAIRNTINVLVTILPLALRNTFFCQNHHHHHHQ